MRWLTYSARRRRAATTATLSKSRLGLVLALLGKMADSIAFCLRAIVRSRCVILSRSPGARCLLAIYGNTSVLAVNGGHPRLRVAHNHTAYLSALASVWRPYGFPSIGQASITCGAL
jgi:hypothetical protein